VNANSRNSEPVSPPRKPIGAYTARERNGHRNDGPDDFRARAFAAMPVPASFPSSRWRWMFSTTTMGVVDHEPDRQHHGQQRQQV